MNTPICDFARRYAAGDPLRLHMPGHKGVSLVGAEPLDLTELDGADSLYEASGIIRESEQNASALFGTQTFYSTEGSSLCIRAMLYLTLLYARQTGKKPLIAAGRNTHKAFVNGAALLDLEVLWLTPGQQASYLSCRLTPQELETVCFREKPAAVYLTSPDYLGNAVDIRAMAEVCHRHGALLLVDSAHGAYLRFLPETCHPMDMGADLCCASAHKTLPVLTGGAYLHLASHLPALFFQQAKNALAMFGSTSPSYLILQSLDAANAYLADGYPEKLADFIGRVQNLKDCLTAYGYTLCGDEPLKVTISAKTYGYTGTALSGLLQRKGIFSEFADPDFLVLMLTPQTGADGLARLADALRAVERREAVQDSAPPFCLPVKRMTIRAAAMSPCETVPADQSAGRVLAAASVGCPPAVPIVVCGEEIDEAALRCFRYYGIESCTVVL